MEAKKIYLSPLAEILCFEPRGAFALLTGESQNEYKDTQALFGAGGTIGQATSGTVVVTPGIDE
ncbi:MAG: hypothetical protein RR336_07835 [Oscillospiraceae bacterium]